MSDSQSKKKNAVKYELILIAVVLGLFIIGGYYYMSNEKTQQSTPPCYTDKMLDQITLSFRQQMNEFEHQRNEFEQRRRLKMEEVYQTMIDWISEHQKNANSDMETQLKNSTNLLFRIQSKLSSLIEN